MKVLLVITDNTAVRQSLQAALGDTDTALFETSVDDATRRLVSLRPDAILLDDSPGLGSAVISPLKSIAPNTPLIALSARGDVISLASLTRAGADEVVVKPFSCETLQDAIERKASRFEIIPAVPRQFSDRSLSAIGSANSASLTQHQMALRWLSRAGSYNDDPKRLSHSLVEAAADIFDTVRSAVALEFDGAVRIVSSLGLSESIIENIRLSYSAGIMRFFDERACLLDRDAHYDAPAATKQMQLLNARIAAPLLRDGRVFGAIFLGDKASGLDFTVEERELLTLLARATSTAFERAAQHTRALRQQGKLDSILEHLDAGVVTIAPDKSVTLINRAAEELLHVHSADLVGRSVQKLGSAFADVALRTLSTGEPLAETIYDAAISARVQVNATPMNGSGIVLVLAKAPEPEVATEKIAYSPFWEYLSARVAQEIKNPMVAINTFAQLLPRKYDSEDFRDAFSQVVQTEVERINGVVETLFTFARNPSLAFRRCSLNDTLKNVLGRFDAQLAEHAIQLDVRYDPRVPEADIDPQYFGQAIENLVQNSIDAMPQGGTLRVHTRTEGDQTEIEISDTGSGVSPENESRIFLPFFSTKERGMGLGLPIASRILEQHQGDLKLVRKPGAQTSFAIHLPARGSQRHPSEKSHADSSGD